MGQGFASPWLRRLGALGLAMPAACQLVVGVDHLDDGCPRWRGPRAVRVESSSGPYCIDSTEVTNAQYQAFADSGYAPAAGDVAEGCTPGPVGTPAGTWPPPPGSEALPVIGVTWCQAHAYCRWAGKRLCGRIAGGALIDMYSTDPAQSQWFNACSGGGQHAYPYGDAFDPNACAGQASLPSAAFVASHPRCVGGFPGLYDLSGNVWEWTDTCYSADADSFCHAMGGAFDAPGPELACKSYRNWTRTAPAGNIGIRCCGDL